MNPVDNLRQSILQRLRTVIDPETGVDVVEMQLVEALQVDERGCVTYRFRPSSFVCPLAVTLALSIQSAISEVAGVTDQEMQVIDFVQAETLTDLLRMEWEQRKAARAARAVLAHTVDKTGASDQGVVS